MRILIDTDIFCKLGVAGLLDEALALLGGSRAECGRLAALPYMLQRGRLVKLYGPDQCATLASLAEGMETAPAADSDWMEPLVRLPTIDAGEAQLLALVAQNGLILLSGDKRALRAVRDASDVLHALHGRVVTLEAVLLALCGTLGVDAVRDAVTPLMATDQTVRVCFSATNSDPVAALLSYIGAMKREVDPLVLWMPTQEAS